MSQSIDGDEQMKQLIRLIHSMNATHREELGDFRCLRFNDNISENITRNYVLRNILEHVIRFTNEEGAETTNSTLKLDCSRVYDKTQRNDKNRQLQTLLAVKSFLRMKEDEAAIKYRGLVSLIRSLPETVKIISLDISRNALDDDDAIVASDAFQGLPTLIELNMSYNRIGVRGADAIFSVLLGHPSCHIRILDLQWNWTICHNPELQEKLVHVLQHENESLTELSLAGTEFSRSVNLGRVFYDFSDEEGSLFDIPEKYNHHLRICEGVSTTDVRKFTMSLNMNEGGPEKAMARKIAHFLEKNEVKIYEGNEDSEIVFRILAFVGKYGNMSSLLKSIQRFTSNGSLFGAS